MLSMILVRVILLFKPLKCFYVGISEDQFISVYLRDRLSL